MNQTEEIKLPSTSITIDSEGNGNGKQPYPEYLFLKLLDTLPSLVVYVNSNYHYQYANKAYADWFGVSIEDIINKSVKDLLGPDAFAHLKPFLEKALGGEQVHIEDEVPYKHGNRFVEASFTPDFDESGNVRGYVGLINDITEKRRIEKELKRKHLELQDYFDNASIGLHRVDGNGIIIWANKAELDLLGYSEEEYIGHHISEFHINKDRIDDILRRLYSRETIKEYEAELRCKDGSVRTVLISSNVLWEDEKFINTRCFTLDITEQKRTEKELRESEQRYRNLIYGLPAAIYTTDKEGYITLYNEAAAELWGRQPEIGKDMWCGSWKIYEPDGVTPIPLASCPMAITLKEGRKVSGEEIIIERPDGVRKNVLPHPEPILDTSGNISGAVNMLLDVTERKIAEEKLGRLAAIVQSSEDAIISKTLEGIITSWNSAAERLFGYTSEEMIGKSITKLIPGDRLTEEPMILERLKKGERVEHFETKRITRDKEILDISLTISPVKDSKGNVIGASKIARDITIQKGLWEKIQDSELLFKTISNASPAALWLTNADEKNVFVNDTWLKWTGKTFEEEINRGWLHSVPEEDRKPIIEKFRHCFKEKKYFNAEFKFIRSDGEIRWGMTEGSPFYDINGNFAGYAGSVTDISDIKKLEQRKDDFIKMASHELKTPITSISGYVQLLLNIYSELDDEKFQSTKATVKSSLATISKQVTKLTRLISELLDLSRIETGKLELHKTEFVLSDLVEETVQDVRHTTSKHAIIVHDDFEGKIFADKDRIAQVLLNLLTNAIKYSPDADNIEVFVEGNKKFCTIKIRDQGIGIDKKDHPRIFERFYRVEGKSEQTYPGFGIGLFIAHEIVQRHHGTITVESEKETGSLFIITLPIEIK